jgi:hypothetical protein
MPSEAAKATGSVNLTDNTELFKISPHEGHGNPPDSHVGICLGEITSPQAGHFLSNRAKWRWSFVLLGTSSSGTEDTKPIIANTTKDKGTELINKIPIAVPLRMPNKRQAPIDRKSVINHAHFRDAVLVRNNRPHAGQRSHLPAMLKSGQEKSFHRRMDMVRRSESCAGGW